MEFDDLNLKCREAEKEVNVLQMKIQEVNSNLSKHRKDMDCEYCCLAQMKFECLYCGSIRNIKIPIPIVQTV